MKGATPLWQALLIVFGSAFGALMFVVGGLLIGTMATDSCGRLPNWTEYYFVWLWPATVLVAVLSPLLFFRSCEITALLLRVCLFWIAPVLIFFGWFLILALLC